MEAILRNLGQLYPLGAHTGCPRWPSSLTTAFVNTKQAPARLPPATAHPIPCNHVTLGSSALCSIVSRCFNALLSSERHCAQRALMNALTACWGASLRDMGIVGDASGE